MRIATRCTHRNTKVYNWNSGGFSRGWLCAVWGYTRRSILSSCLLRGPRQRSDHPSLGNPLPGFSLVRAGGFEGEWKINVEGMPPGDCAAAILKVPLNMLPCITN